VCVDFAVAGSMVEVHYDWPYGIVTSAKRNSLASVNCVSCTSKCYVLSLMLSIEVLCVVFDRGESCIACAEGHNVTSSRGESCIVQRGTM
jgi:hypothetical protein